MTVEYLDLADCVAIAAEVTGLDVNTVMKVTNLGLADSALHAPAAGFGDTDFYPDFIDKAAVLVVRLAGNHPLPDGNNGSLRADDGRQLPAAREDEVGDLQPVRPQAPAVPGLPRCRGPR